MDKRNPNAENTYRDAYDLINARIALSEVDGLGGQWELALWGKNLADNDYEAFALDNLPRPVALLSGEMGAATVWMSPIVITS